MLARAAKRILYQPYHAGNVDGPTNRSSEIWGLTRNDFSISLLRIGIRQAAPLASPRITQDHPGSPRLARHSPVSRERKAALTLRWKRDEDGADFCHLSTVLTFTEPYAFVRHSSQTGSVIPRVHLYPPDFLPLLWVLIQRFLKTAKPRSFPSACFWQANPFCQIPWDFLFHMADTD